MTTQPDSTLFDHDIAGNMEETVRSYVQRPIIIHLDGNEVNRRYRIDKPQFGIGRDLLGDVVLADNRCSRRHARLLYENYDQTGEVPRIMVQDLNSTNGTFVNGVRITEHPLNDRDRILIGSTMLGFFMRDECELEADQRLYFMARNDALTGLLNRGIFNLEIQKEFDRAQRYSRSLSLVIFDIDHFKRFNDNYGHQVGDFVLQELGQRVRANIRGNDIAARYGGEEFVIILPETPLEGALIQAERLRTAVCSVPFTRDGMSFEITISLGLASTDPSIRCVEEFIKSTDRALYQAKADGRNCSCWMRNGQLNSGSATHQIQSVH